MTGRRRPATVRTASGWFVCVLLALLLGACGADVERQEAAAAADAFTAEAGSDPAAACARLAPRTREALEEEGGCAATLAGAGIPAAGERGTVSVAGHSAQVRYAADTVFLALFDDGWRVTAAGCDRRSQDRAVPYDCAVEGG